MPQLKFFKADWTFLTFIKDVMSWAPSHSWNPTYLLNSQSFLSLNWRKKGTFLVGFFPTKVFVIQSESIMIYLLIIYLIIVFLFAQNSLNCRITFVLLAISVIDSTSFWRIVVSLSILIILGISLVLKIISIYTESKVIKNSYIEWD